MTATLDLGLTGARQHSRELLPDDLVEPWEERAAIMEYDGGLSRADAEAAAWQCLCPPSVPPGAGATGAEDEGVEV